MRRAAPLALTLLLAACGGSEGARFTPEPDASLDAADAAKKDAAAPDRPPPDAGALDARPADAAAADAARDLPIASDVAAPPDGPAPADVGAPDVGDCGATPLGSRTGVVATGTTAGAGSRGGACGGEEAGEAVYAWTAPRAGSYRIDTGGSDYDTVLYVLDGGCAGEEIDCNDDAEKTVQSELTVTLRAGQTVVIVVDGYDGDATGDFALNITEVAAADAGAPDA